MTDELRVSVERRGNDGAILCLFEKGGKKGIEKIELARFTLGWLTDGQDEGASEK